MKDSYYFKHDSNARHDPKIINLINDYGMDGYGRFWVVIEMLREATAYKLETKDYVWSAMSLELKIKPEQVKKFINDCIKKYELFQNGDGYFYSLSLVVRMNKLDEIREKRRRAAETRWSGNEQ